MTSNPVAQAYNAPINFFISQTPPDNIKDKDVLAALREVYNGIQNVIQGLVNNCGIGPQPGVLWPDLDGNPITLLSGNLNRLYVKASENIAEGAIINLFKSGAVLKVRNANATNNTKPADGFCTTTGGITAGAVGELQLATGVIGIAGLTIGTRYFLSTVNGLVTAAAPVAAGNIEQYLGIAITTTQLFANIGYWIQH